MRFIDKLKKVQKIVNDREPFLKTELSNDALYIIHQVNKNDSDSGIYLDELEMIVDLARKYKLLCYYDPNKFEFVFHGMRNRNNQNK